MGHRLLIILWMVSGAWPAESLYVFFPSAVRPQVLQRKISALGPGVEVTVFGRFTDFEEQANRVPPDAVLTLREVVRVLDGYTLKQGGNGKVEEGEPLLLLSIDRGMDLAAMVGTTIGVVDILGRKRMKDFIAGILKPGPALKTVTKVEDLLPLITFKMADCILVTESQAAYLRSLSNLKLVATPVPEARSGPLSLALRKGKAAPGVVRIMRSMDSELQKLMGDVRWD